MPIKVRVRDFQSLEDVSLTIDGLTVVTGANNTGKSALMRAIRAAFQNAKGTSFIRHGKPKAIVEVEFDDGRSLVWEKGRGKGDKPTYRIDGGDPIYPGQGVPEEVRELGMRPLVVGNREMWPQFANQFTGTVFLLDEPGSVMAEAVADVDRVSQLNEALRMASSDLRGTQGELTTRRGDLSKIDMELKRFIGLDDLITETHEIEAKAALLKRLDTALQALHILRSRLQEAERAVNSLSGVLGVDVPSASEAEGLRIMSSDRDVMVRCKERLEKARSRENFLAGIKEVEVPDTVSIIESTMKERDALTGVQRRLDTARSSVRLLRGIEEVAVPEPLDAVVAMAQEREGLVDVARRYRRAKAQVDRLSQVDLTVEVDTATLEKIQGAVQLAVGLRDHLSLAQSNVHEAEQELLSAQAEEDRATEELVGSRCPVCGGLFQHEGVHP
jgi:hypothetical protein